MEAPPRTGPTPSPASGERMTSSTGPTIEVRNTFTITITNGHLTRDQVPMARTTTPGGIVEVNVLGEVRFVDLGALVNIGAALADAERVIVRATGSGLDHLRTEVARSIKSEMAFRASDARSRADRRASLDRQIAGGYLPADFWDLEDGK